MLIHAVPQWQVGPTDRASLFPAGCRALAALAADVLEAAGAAME